MLDRNFRTRHGELDLIACDERYLVFCEVKTRSVTEEPGADGPADARPLGPLAGIGAAKRRQVRAIAREWLARRPEAEPVPPRSASTRSA